MPEGIENFGRAYVVTMVNGPANGWSYITFIQPDARILVAPKPFHSPFGDWYRALIAEPHPDGAVVYERGPLPTEPDDKNVTVDGDWFVPYTVAT